MQIARLAAPPQRRLSQANSPAPAPAPEPPAPEPIKKGSAIPAIVGTVVGAAAGVACALNPGMLSRVGGTVLAAGSAGLGTTIGVGAILFNLPGPSGHTAGWGAAVGRGLASMAAGVAGGIGGGVAGYLLGGQASALSVGVLGLAGAATGMVAGASVQHYMA